MEEEVRISDLESHNGVRVNGERVGRTGAAERRRGDAGNVTLVFHCGDRSPSTAAPLDASALRVRLAEEIERVLSYERSVSVIAMELGVSVLRWTH